MGYLICQKCKGYYKLQPGEKPEDFTDTCACGGNLRYAINMDVINTETPPINNPRNEKKEYQKSKNENKSNKTENKDNKSKLISCPDCGHQLSKKAKTCPNCGRKLNYIDIHGHRRKMTIPLLFTMMGGLLLFCLIILGIAFVLNSDFILFGDIGIFIVGVIMLSLAYNDNKKYFKQLKQTN